MMIRYKQQIDQIRDRYLADQKRGLRLQNAVRRDHVKLAKRCTRLESDVAVLAAELSRVVSALERERTVGDEQAN